MASMQRRSVGSFDFAIYVNESGLAIYAARGLRSGTADLPLALVGHLSGGFNCEFGGGNRGAEEERKHAETQIARDER